MASEASESKFTTALVTGANQGIGLAIVTQLKAAGVKVYATVRKTSEELEKVGVEKVITGIDVADDGIIETLAAAVKGVTFDLVINNAGVFSIEKTFDIDFAYAQKVFNINGLGPIRVIKALLDNVKEGSKIINISTMMASITDTLGNPYNGGIKAISYRGSKAALNMFTAVISQELEEKGVIVAAIHPGFVLTRLTRGFGDAGQISTDESATGVLKVAAALSKEDSGKALYSYSGVGDKFGW